MQAVERAQQWHAESLDSSVDVADSLNDAACYASASLRLKVTSARPLTTL
jgi:hypothetical protein